MTFLSRIFPALDQFPGLVAMAKAPPVVSTTKMAVSPRTILKTMMLPDGLLGPLSVMSLMLAGTVATIAGPVQPAASPADRDLLGASYYCEFGSALDALDAGANVNAQDERRQTPLMLAAMGACDDLVAALIERGADLAAKNDKRQTALDMARMVDDPDIIEAIEAALGKGTADEPGSASDASEQVPYDEPGTATEHVGGRADTGGFVPWPDLGTYAPGQKVISSWVPAAKWDLGVVTKIDRDDNFYHVEDNTHSVMPFARSQVAAPEREPYWTGWFVGNWNVSVPVSMVTTEGTDGWLYDTVYGGLALPPLRINADGTYTWKLDDNGQARVIEGRWIAREDAPGVVLENGAENADWLVYNSTDNVTDRDEIHLHNPRFTYFNATRIEESE